MPRPSFKPRQATTKERRERLAEIDAQVRAGSLTIRKMTDAERERFGRGRLSGRSDPPRRAARR